MVVHKIKGNGRTKKTHTTIRGSGLFSKISDSLGSSSNVKLDAADIKVIDDFFPKHYDEKDKVKYGDYIIATGQYDLQSIFKFEDIPKFMTYQHIYEGISTQLNESMDRMDSAIIYITCQEHNSHNYIKFFCYIKFSSTDKTKFSIYDLLYKPVEKSANVFNGEKFIVTVTAIKLNLKPILLDHADKEIIKEWNDQQITIRSDAYTSTKINTYKKCDEFKDLIVKIMKDIDNIDKYTDSVYEIKTIRDTQGNPFKRHPVYMKFIKDENGKTNCTIYSLVNQVIYKPTNRLPDNDTIEISKLTINSGFEPLSVYEARIESKKEEDIEREKRRLAFEAEKLAEKVSKNMERDLKIAEEAQSDRSRRLVELEAVRQTQQMRTGGKKKRKTAVVKKIILGKERCIYKIPASKKEHVKYKGTLVTVADYKNIMKSKAKAKAKAKAKPKAKAKA
jgi:hypothetical protein